MPPTIGRIPVLDIWPTVSGGTRATKAVVDEAIRIGATVFREGHDAVAAEVVVIDPSGNDHQRVRMEMVGQGTDRYEATITLPEMGHWAYRVEAWSDVVGTWLHHIHVKIPAGVDQELEFAEGVLVLERIAGDAGGPPGVVLAPELVVRGSTAVCSRSAQADAPPQMITTKKQPARASNSAGTHRR